MTPVTWGGAAEAAAQAMNADDKRRSLVFMSLFEFRFVVVEKVSSPSLSGRGMHWNAPEKELALVTVVARV